MFQAAAAHGVLSVHFAQLLGTGCRGVRAVGAGGGNLCPGASVQRPGRPPRLHAGGVGHLSDDVHGARG